MTLTGQMVANQNVHNNANRCVFVTTFSGHVLIFIFSNINRSQIDENFLFLFHEIDLSLL